MLAKKEGAVVSEMFDHIADNKIRPQDSMALLFSTALAGIIITTITMFFTYDLSELGGIGLLFWIISSVFVYYLNYLINYLFLALFVGIRILWQYHRKQKNIKMVDKQDVYVYLVLWVISVLLSF